MDDLGDVGDFEEPPVRSCENCFFRRRLLTMGPRHPYKTPSTHACWRGREYDGHIMPQPLLQEACSKWQSLDAKLKAHKWSNRLVTWEEAK